MRSILRQFSKTVLVALCCTLVSCLPAGQTPVQRAQLDEGAKIGHEVYYNDRCGPPVPASAQPHSVTLIDSASALQQWYEQRQLPESDFVAPTAIDFQPKIWLAVDLGNTIQAGTELQWLGARLERSKNVLVLDYRVNRPATGRRTAAVVSRVCSMVELENIDAYDRIEVRAADNTLWHTIVLPAN